VDLLTEFLTFLTDLEVFLTVLEFEASEIDFLREHKSIINFPMFILSPIKSNPVKLYEYHILQFLNR
jgi:hypothetical protein